MNNCLTVYEGKFENEFLGKNCKCLPGYEKCLTKY